MRKITTFFRDSLTNLTTGMRTRKDSMTNAFFSDVNVERDFRQLSSAYRTSWATNKVVNIVADDMVREWREFSSKNEKSNEILKIKKEEDRVKVIEKINTAIRWSRLYGGCALFLSVKGQEDVSIPLDLDAIKEGDLLNINVIERPYVTVYNTNIGFFDPSSDDFEEPEYYWLAEATMRVHRSHIIILKGEPASRANGNLNNFFWGDSIVSSLYESIRNSESVNNVIASLINEANVDIIKVNNLSAILSGTCGEDALRKRFEIANELKSTFSMLLLDGKEDYDRKTVNFSNLPQIQDVFLKIVSAAASIPATKFLSEGTTGLSDTGENDLRMYYDDIKLKQVIKLKPALVRLDEVLFRSALGFMPDDITFEFNSLWQISDTEKADIELKNSQTDIAYFNAGIITQEMILKKLQKENIYQISDADIDDAMPAQFTNEDIDGANTRIDQDAESGDSEEQDYSSVGEAPIQS